MNKKIITEDDDFLELFEEINKKTEEFFDSKPQKKRQAARVKARDSALQKLADSSGLTDEEILALFRRGKSS